MKQLTKKQAIAMVDSKVWEKWSDEEVVKFQLFQDRLCLPFGRFHQAMENVLGRPIWTHEFTSTNHQNLCLEFLGEKKPPSFDEIIALIPSDKLVLIGIQE